MKIVRVRLHFSSNIIDLSMLCVHSLNQDGHVPPKTVLVVSMSEYTSG